MSLKYASNHVLYPLLIGIPGPYESTINIYTLKIGLFRQGPGLFYIYEQNNNLHFLYIFFVLSKQLILRYLINLRNLKNAAGMWVSPGMAVFSIRWHATIKFVSHYKWNEVKDYNLFSFLIIPPTTSHQIMNVIFHFVLKDLI